MSKIIFISIINACLDPCSFIYGFLNWFVYLDKHSLRNLFMKHPPNFDDMKTGRSPAHWSQLLTTLYSRSMHPWSFKRGVLLDDCSPLLHAYISSICRSDLEMTQGVIITTNPSEEIYIFRVSCLWNTRSSGTRKKNVNIERKKTDQHQENYTKHWSWRVWPVRARQW